MIGWAVAADVAPPMFHRNWGACGRETAWNSLKRMSQFSYCGRQARRYDRDRFLCASMAPAEEREALFALLAFNSEIARIREIVHEPLLGHMRLAWWRDSLDGVFEGRPERHDILEALSNTVQKYSLSRQPFERLIEARAFDLDDVAPATMEALESYAEGTASTLQQLHLEVLGARRPDAVEAARHLGIAWAVTGLIRAVPFHAAGHRCYLPADLCRDAGLELEGLYAEQARPALRHVLAALAKTARSHLGSARKNRTVIPKRAVSAMLPGVLADHYLKRLERAGFDPFSARTDRLGPTGLVRLFWKGSIRRSY